MGFMGETPALLEKRSGSVAFGRRDTRVREKLHVGLSRARDLVVVWGDPEEIGRTGDEAVLRRLPR